MERKAEKETEAHLLLANYIRMKVEAGYFPKGSCLPSPQEFMKTFKLSFSTTLKAIMELERDGVLLTLPEIGAKVVSGPEGSPKPLEIKRDIQELFELFELLEAELLSKAWPRIDALELNRKLRSAQGMKPAEKTFFVTLAIQEELGRAAGSRALIQAQNQTMRQLSFLRLKHLRALSEGKALDHAIEIESIVALLCAGDYHGVRQRILNYLSTLKAEMLSLFEEGASLLAQAPKEPEEKSPESVNF